jgi:hypothetical protein
MERDIVQIPLASSVLFAHSPHRCDRRPAGDGVNLSQMKEEECAIAVP